MQKPNDPLDRSAANELPESRYRGTQRVQVMRWTASKMSPGLRAPWTCGALLPSFNPFPLILNPPTPQY